MNLKEQQYIVMLADCGSITMAAKRLGVTQPALSAYLSNLEAGLGAKLFNRMGKQLIPTYLGEIYLETARRIVALGNGFNTQLAKSAQGAIGRLRFGLQIRRSPFLIPALFKAFSNEYPNVEVILHEANMQTLENLLLNNQLDLLLCNRASVSRELEVFPICEDRLLFVTSSSHPCCRSAQYRSGLPYPWVDIRLFSNDMFLLQHPGQSIRRFSDQLLERAGIQPRRVFLVRNIETAYQLAAEGVGVSFNMESYLTGMHYQHPPALFVTGEEPVTTELCAACRRGTDMPEHMQVFISLLRSVLRMQSGPAGSYPR